MNDATAFAPPGNRILDSQAGDFGGQGQSGMLVIYEATPSGNERLGEGKARTVVLLLRDPSGNLRKATENDRIVPCARCGGTAGDPFGYARIGKGGFTIGVSGGSRERWADEYNFGYDPAQRTWIVTNVVREVIDNETEEYERLELGTDKLGQVTFADFDPKALPTPTIGGEPNKAD